MSALPRFCFPLAPAGTWANIFLIRGHNLEHEVYEGLAILRPETCKQLFLARKGTRQQAFAGMKSAARTAQSPYSAVRFIETPLDQILCFELIDQPTGIDPIDADGFCQPALIDVGMIVDDR